MRNRVLLVLLALILAVVPLFIACAAPTPAPPAPEEEAPAPPAKPISLSFANFPPAPTFPCVSMERWADEVEKRTNGKVVVDTFPGGTLLTSPAMFDGVLSGVADIGCSCPSYEPGRFPLIVGMETPRVKFDSVAVASQALWEACQEFKPESLARFKVLYMYTAGPNHICTIEPVRTLDDLQGLPLRASGAVVPIMKALGAAPEGMPQSEVPEALAKGRIKGYISSDDVLMDFKYAEIVKYRTDWSPCIGCSFAVVMNKPAWNSLPADVQKVMDELALEQSVWTGEYMDTHCGESLQWAIDEQGLEVITISATEKAKWDALLEPVTESWLADMEAKGLPGKAYLDKLTELRDKYSK
ncbi:MAG: TRAP transporter substrate-binding protein [Dehalococcoidia bacterium]|nr:TRAP transporter substrate-binding protein [Dehalococcoidia bacterium]